MSQQGGPRWRWSTRMLTVCTSSVIDVTLGDSLLHAHGTRIRSLSMLETTQENLCLLAGLSTWELTFQHPGHMVKTCIVYLQSYRMYNGRHVICQ